MSQHQTCTHPEAHVHTPEAMVAAVGAVCQQRGLRFTKRRKQVMRCLASMGKPVKAYELMDLLRDDSGPLAPPSVYRALDFLVEEGFIHKLESIKAFVACHHPAEAHSVPFLICDACHMTVELEDESISQSLQKQAAELGFTPRAQTLEVHGVCVECQKKTA